MSELSAENDLAQQWYIHKQPSGECLIVSADSIDTVSQSHIVESWGPFNSKGEAIARRVGLIRSGKCQPI